MSSSSRPTTVIPPLPTRSDRPRTPTLEPQFGTTPSPDSVEPAPRNLAFQADTLHDRYASSAEQSLSNLSKHSGSVRSSSSSRSSEKRRAFIQVHSSPEIGRAHV